MLPVKEIPGYRKKKNPLRVKCTKVHFSQKGTAPIYRFTRKLGSVISHMESTNLTVKEKINISCCQSIKSPLGGVKVYYQDQLEKPSMRAPPTGSFVLLKQLFFSFFPLNHKSNTT